MAGDSRARAPARGRAVAADERGQQFVLEAVIVAVIAVTTIVLVANLQPSSPALEQPRTRSDLKSLAQDTLDNMAASPAPACSLEVGCQPDNVLAHKLLGQLAAHDYEVDRGKDGPFYQHVQDLLPAGVHAYATVCIDGYCMPVSGDPPPANESLWRGVTAQKTFVPRTSFAHVHTDFKTYDANQLGDAGTFMRAYVMAMRNSLPMGPMGAAVEVTVHTNDTRPLRSFVHTAENDVATSDQPNGSQPGVELYLECEKLDEDDRLTGQSCDGGSRLDQANYDALISNDMLRTDQTLTARFRVTIREKANVTIPEGTKLIVEVPPDWKVIEDSESEASSYPSGSQDRLAEITLASDGSRERGWVIHAQTRVDLAGSTNESHATLRFDAVPPNPHDNGSRNDPEQTNYVFEAHLEKGAHSTLSATVSLDTDSSPLKGALDCFASMPVPMGRNQTMRAGVSCKNPTETDRTVSQFDLEAVDDKPIFRNTKVVRGGGVSHVRGLQNAQEHVVNGQFDQGQLKWTLPSWKADPTVYPIWDQNHSVVAIDSGGQPHVFYTRTDGSIAHVWRLPGGSQAPWNRSKTGFNGTLGSHAVAIDRKGTDARSDDVIHMVLRGRSGSDPGPGIWHVTYRLDSATWSDPVRIWGAQSGSGGLFIPSNVNLELRDGTPHVGLFMARLGAGNDTQANYTGQKSIVYLAADGSFTSRSADCPSDSWQDAGWWCLEMEVDNEVRTLTAELGPDALHFLFQVNFGPGDFAVHYCKFPCEDVDQLKQITAMWANKPHDIKVDKDGRVHVAMGLFSKGLWHGVKRSGDGCVDPGWRCAQITDQQSANAGIGFWRNGSTPMLLYAASPQESVDAVIKRAVPSPKGSGCGTDVEAWDCRAFGQPVSGEMMTTTIGPRGVVHVSHLGPDDHTVRYGNSTMHRGAWSFEPGPLGFNISAEVGGGVSAVGEDDGDVHVAYQDETQDWLKYARYNASAGTWTIEAVDRGKANLGWRTDIALINGTPQIAYYTYDGVRRAKRNPDNGSGCRFDNSWTCTRVADAALYSQSDAADRRIGIDQDADGVVGILFIARDGKPTVAVSQSSVDDCAGSGPHAGDWRCLTVPADAADRDPSMAMTDGRIHVVWQGSNEDRLLYSTSVPDSVTGLYGPFSLPTLVELAEPDSATVSESVGKEPVIDRFGNHVGVLSSARRSELCPTIDCISVEGHLSTDTNASYGDDMGEAGICNVNWSCQDVGRSTSAPGTGDLVFDDGVAHGLLVRGSGDIRYVTVTESGDVTRSPGHIAAKSHDADDRIAALARAGNRTYIFRKAAGNLHAAWTDPDADTSCRSSHDGIPWRCATIDDGDGASQVGAHPSVAVDVQGRPHVAHYDRSLDNLVYSTRIDGSWTREVVDRGLQSLGSMRGLDIAWDADGAAHAIYRTEAPRTMRYATNASGEWRSEVVSRNATGVETAISARDGDVHAVWVTPAGQLVHAARQGSDDRLCDVDGWTCAIVDLGVETADVAIRQSGTLSVVYVNDTELRHAVPGSGSCSADAPSGWECETLDDSPGDWRASGTWDAEVDASVRPSDGLLGVAYHHNRSAWWIEQAPSTDSWSRERMKAFDGNLEYGGLLSVTWNGTRPAVAYTGYASGGYLVNLTERTNGTWTSQWVAHVEDLQSLSMAVSAEVPHVHWTKGSPAHVMQATPARNGSCPGGPWECEVLVSVDGETYHGVASRTTGGDVEVVYRRKNGTASWIERARDNGSAWTFATVPDTLLGDVGRYASLALDDAGDPHISYHDRGNGTLKHAELVDGRWNITTVDASSNETGISSSLVIWGGEPAIAYQDRDNARLMFAVRNGTEWIREVVRNSTDGMLNGTAPGNVTDLRIAGTGNPAIAYSFAQSEVDGVSYWLGMADRDGWGDGCGSAANANWSCADLHESGRMTGVSLQVLDDGNRTILYDVDADGGHELWIARGQANASDGACDVGGTWTCEKLDTAEGPMYPSHEIDAADRLFGIYLAAEDPATDLGLQLSGPLPGTSTPVDADVQEVTDAVVSPDPACSGASTYQCKPVWPDVRVARTDTAMGRQGRVTHAVVESGEERTFLHGSNEDWGSTVAAGHLEFEVIDEVTTPDPYLRARGDLHHTTGTYATGTANQSFVMGRVPSSALLAFNWSKTLNNTDDLSLSRFHVEMSIDRIDRPDRTPSVVWSTGRLGATGGWRSAIVPVGDVMQEKGVYSLNVTVEVQGRVTRDGETASAAFKLDDVSLESYLNKHLPINNSRFDYPQDDIADPSGSWDEAGDGGWEVTDALVGASGSKSDPDQDYMKSWVERDQEPSTAFSGVAAEPYATHEFARLVQWEGNELKRHETRKSTVLQQTFEIPEIDGEGPHAVRLNGDLQQFARAVASGVETTVEIDDDSLPDNDLREQVCEINGGAGEDCGDISDPDGAKHNFGAGEPPDCEDDVDPRDDPCSYWASGESAARQSAGTPYPIGELLTINDKNWILVEMRLRNEDTGAVKRFWSRNTSLVWDTDLGCREACNIQPYNYRIRNEDVTDFVEREGPGNYTLEVTTEVQIEPAHDFDPDWTLYNVLVGHDNLFIEADYGGGTTVRWTGNGTIPAGGSTDWVLEIKGNGVETTAPGDRVCVPFSFSNDYATDACHMERWGMYVAEVRPEECTDLVDSTTCEEWDELGYDADPDSQITARLWMDEPILGQRSYRNSPEAALTSEVLQSLRQDTRLELVNGEGRYQSIPRDNAHPGRSVARVKYNFTELAETVRNLDSLVGNVDRSRIDLLRFRIHDPVFGQETWSVGRADLDGTLKVPFDELPIFYGTYVMEASLEYEVETANGTHEQAARVLEYFTVVPEDGVMDPSPAYNVKLLLWRPNV